MAKSKAGPLITDNGNFIIDFGFKGVSDWKKLNDEIIALPGVVETGLFISMAKCVILGNADGTIKTLPNEWKEMCIAFLSRSILLEGFSVVEIAEHAYIGLRLTSKYNFHFAIVFLGNFD